MGLLNSMTSWFRGRSVETRAAGGVVGRGDLEGGLLAPGAGGRGPPARGTRELIAAYREQPWLRAVTNRIARGVASVRWGVYVRAAEPVASPGRMAPPWRWGTDRAVRDVALLSPSREGRAKRMAQLQRAGVLREVTDHPMLELLQRPNPMMTGHTAIQVTQVWLDIKGEAFWLVSYDDAGVPNGLWPVPPHWVTSCPNAAAPYFTLSSGAVQMRLEPSAVLWLRDIDPENPYGRGAGVAESLGDELETDEYAAKYLKAWFFNNATPSIIVAFEEARNLNAAALEQVREKWEAAHRGVHNAHRAHFVSGKMNAVKLDTSFRDQQLLELRRMHRDTVIQVFGVPPECVGVIENSNRATIDAAAHMYAVGVEHPRCEFLRAELAHQLLPKFKGGASALLEVELSSPQDQSRRLEVMRAQPAGFFLNEFRIEAGYEPLLELEGEFAAGVPGAAPTGAKPPADTKPADVEPEDDTADGAEPPEDELEPPELESSRMDPPWAQHLRRR
jgi:HK97 family phage portal protein